MGGSGTSEIAKVHEGPRSKSLQIMARLRSAMLCVLVLGFGGAATTGACGSNEAGPVDSSVTPPDTLPDTPPDTAGRML